MSKQERASMLLGNPGRLFDQNMFNITVDRPAEEMLLWLKLRDRVIHGRIAKAIDELEQKGIHHTQIYRLSDPDPIYRRRI